MIQRLHVIRILWVVVFLLPFISACQSMSPKILIIYLSRTKNTKVLAEIIHNKMGGKLVELELEKPYPENYQAIVAQVQEELGNGYLPPLKTKIDSIRQYDIIFVGFPTWAMSLPPPMQSFLHQNPFEGKILVLFNTNAGYGLGSTIDKIKELCPKAEIKEAFSMVGGKEKDGIFLTIKGEKEKKTEESVDNWLKRIKLINFKNK